MCTIYNSVFGVLYLTIGQYIPFHCDGKVEEQLVDFAAIVGFNLADKINGKYVERLYAFKRAEDVSRIPLIDEIDNPIRCYNQRYVMLLFFLIPKVIKRKLHIHSHMDHSPLYGDIRQ